MGNDDEEAAGPGANSTDDQVIPLLSEDDDDDDRFPSTIILDRGKVDGDLSQATAKGSKGAVNAITKVVKQKEHEVSPVSHAYCFMH